MALFTHGSTILLGERVICEAFLMFLTFSGLCVALLGRALESQKLYLFCHCKLDDTQTPEGRGMEARGAACVPVAYVVVLYVKHFSVMS